MTRALSPPLAHFKNEAAIIGRLLTGYTAIEYQLCMCAGMGGGDVGSAIRRLFGKRGETGRVERAVSFGRAGYASAGLGDAFDKAINDMLFCVAVRNQYAHCIWHNDRSGHLAFAHMEEIAASHWLDPDPFNLTFLHVDEPLLRKQEDFFIYVFDTFKYLNYKRRQTLGEIGMSASLRFPTSLAEPPINLEGKQR